jgi:phosphate ABC transporter, permease protein PstA
MINDNMVIKEKSRRLDNTLGTAYSILSMLLILFTCAFLLIVILYYGAGTLSLRFLVTEPDASALGAAAGGILTPIIGTCILTLIGIIIAFPFALATAIYLRFYSKSGLFKTLVTSAIDILSGVPTIVIALFALAIFTQPFFSALSSEIAGADGVSKAFGKSFLVSGITMAVMILPFVAKSMEEALKTVPQSYIDGSMALGATQWQTISKVVLSCARDGLVTGTILGMGRIIGDTAIVWLTLGGTLRMTGNQPWYSVHNWISTLQNTGCTLTSYIFYTSPAGEGNQLDVAFGASLVLVVIIILLNLATSLIGNLGGRKNG